MMEFNDQCIRIHHVKFFLIITTFINNVILGIQLSHDAFLPLMFTNHILCNMKYCCAYVFNIELQKYLKY